jgi:hypothetical protein
MEEERFIITGGKRNDAPFSMKTLSDCYEAGIYEIDFEGKRLRRSYTEARPDYQIYARSYSLTFRGGSLWDGSLYTCTHSEIVEFDVSTFTIRNRRSHRLFNDLHHVAATDNRLLFASTGIDHIGEYSEAGEIRLYPVLDGSEYERPDMDTDYRILSTKPHRSHPNHVFQVGDRLWATRFNQKDAVCLCDLSRRLPIGVGKPHDGLIREGRLHFTTVDGKLVIYDPQTLERLALHDIAALYRNDNPGWCRGLEVIGEIAYVGFSAFRWTLSLENIGFLAKNLVSLGKKLKRDQPARIVKYDMRGRRIVEEMLLDEGEIGVIFSILRVPSHLFTSKGSREGPKCPSTPSFDENVRKSDA